MDLKSSSAKISAYMTTKAAYLNEYVTKPLSCKTINGKRESYGSVQNPCAVSPSSSRDSHKVFNDPVHGYIELSPLCVCIIDTPQFQRLRDLYQLGACYRIFPGASHKRFEHSLGTCHLAGLLTRTLRERQPELNITSLDALCVEIAGLCHDLGHGPFSHLFDGLFIPKARPGRQWKHEDASVKMFEYLLTSNKLRPVFTAHGLTERDIVFVKEMISGCLWNGKEEWTLKGRDESKSFLYEIVSNKRNGVDVDKWDYFSRDCYNLGVANSFDHMRAIKFMRVLCVEGQLQICFRDKEAENLYNMFHVRYELHRRAYQHKINKVVEDMICRALIQADPYITYTASNGKCCCISECIDDMSAYTQLSDNVYYRILWSTDERLQPARDLLMRIENRDLYKYIGSTKPLPSIKTETWDKDKIAEDIYSHHNATTTLSLDDIMVQVVKLDYGMNNKNPIDHMRFYRKDNPQKAFCVRRENVSDMLPACFQDKHIRVYCKNKDEMMCDELTECFTHWCKQAGMAAPKESDVFNVSMTPIKENKEEKELYHSSPEKKPRISLL